MVVFQIYYRVGSRNESLGHTGLSHILEHVMFKGTDKVGPEEYSKIIQRNGGRTNAWTTDDNTTYFATLASDRVGVVIDLEADRMTNLKLTDEVFLPERSVIMEERRLRIDNNPVADLFEQLSATAYARASVPVSGHRLDVRHRAGDARRRPAALPDVLHPQQRLRRRRRRLRQRRAHCARSAPPSVRSRAGPAAAGRARHRAAAARRAPRRAEARGAAPVRRHGAPRAQPAQRRRRGARGARRRSSPAATAPACTSELVYRLRLARDAGASYDYTSIDPGLFTLYAQPLPGQSVAAVEAALRREIDAAAAAPPSARELEKAKNGIEAHFVFAQDSLFYQAMLLGQYEVAGDWRRHRRLPACRARGHRRRRPARRAHLPAAENRTTGVLDPRPAGVGAERRRSRSRTGAIH